MTKVFNLEDFEFDELDDSKDDFMLALQLQMQMETNLGDDDDIKVEKNTQAYKSPVKPGVGDMLHDPQWDLIDPCPDIRALFQEYDKKYFWNTLGSCIVEWSKRMTICAGIFYLREGGIIRLSEPLLKYRPRKDLVDTLLHEMIHAYLYLTRNYKDRGEHGDEFKGHMNRINKLANTTITVYHSFHDEVNYQRQHVWRCNGPCRTHAPFYGYVKRSMNRAPGKYDTWWSQHQAKCNGVFEKIAEPEGFKDKNSKNKSVLNETSSSQKVKKENDKTIAKKPSSKDLTSSSQTKTLDSYFKNPSSQSQVSLPSTSQSKIDSNLESKIKEPKSKLPKLDNYLKQFLEEETANDDNKLNEDEELKRKAYKPPLLSTLKTLPPSSNLNTAKNEIKKVERKNFDDDDDDIKEVFVKKCDIIVLDDNDDTSKTLPSIKNENTSLINNYTVKLIECPVIGNNLIEDHKADAFNPPIIIKKSNSIDKYLNYSLTGYANWDAKHFTHIAEYGYIYEHSSAFFPLLPLTIKLFTEYFLSNFLYANTLVYLLGGVLLNFIYFNIATIYLYKLTLILFNNNNPLAVSTILLYSLNPANIFFSAVYSESLFSMLTFSSIYCLYTNKFLLAVVLVFSSCLCRSNGILNFGYIAYYCLKEHLSSIKITQQFSEKTSFFKYVRFFCFKTLNLGFIKNFLLILKLIVSFACAYIAFFLYQYYIYSKFCKLTQSEKRNIYIPNELIKYGQKNSYHLINNETNPNWCSLALPFSYTHVQANYWKVGFLTYWQFKQIPNFLLASPVLYLVIRSVKRFLSSFNSKNMFNLFGLVNLNDEHKFYSKFDKNKNLFPFSIHLLALFVSALFFMHVQVSTRFIFSSSPFIYWYGGSLIATELKLKDFSLSEFINQLFNNKKLRSAGQIKFIFIYFLAYSLIGTLLFANFYPYT